MTSDQGGTPVSFTVRARTDLGRARDHNEDTFLIADLASRTTDLTNGGPHKVGERGTLFLVADGMGGAAAGELASSMAADVIFRHLLSSPGNSQHADPEGFALQLREAVEAANAHIHGYSKEHPDVRGMGTTATVAGVLQGTLYLAQVGDSRGYLVRDGIATQLTKDQSLMQRLVDAGELTEEEAEQSERRNIILQALGPDAKIRVDLSWQELRRGDVLVICSDGLSGQVKREEIAALVEQHPDLDALCDQLILLANERGGPDNITVVAARFDGDGLPPAGAGNSGEVGYRTMLKEETSETPTPLPPRPSAASPPPSAGAPAPAPLSGSAPVPEPPAAPVPARSGSPLTIAALTLVIIALLTVLYFLLRR